MLRELKGNASELDTLRLTVYYFIYHLCGNTLHAVGTMNIKLKKNVLMSSNENANWTYNPPTANT